MPTERPRPDRNGAIDGYKLARGRRFPHQIPLDGLRGLAALGVLCHHTLYTSVPGGDIIWHLNVLRYGSSFGDLGVSLFFVLSGYLITSLLLVDRRRPHFYHNFYWKRVFRVLPPLVFVLLVTWALGYVEWPTVVLVLLFILNFNELLHIPASGPYWSLSIEEQFYLIWPAIVRKLSPRAMRNTMIAIVACEPFIRFLSVALGHGRPHYTFMQCDGLAWGALLAIMAHHMRIPYRDYNVRMLWRSFGLPAFVSGIILAGVSEALLLTHQKTYLLQLTAAVLLFTGIITFVICWPRSFFSRVLSKSPLLFLGSISYMMYLSHAYFMQVYDDYLRKHVHLTGAAEYYIRFAFVLVVTIIFCTASLHLLERPMMRRRRYVLR